MKWNELISLILEKTVKYEDLEAPFNYMQIPYVAYGDATLSTDDESLDDSEVSLYEIREVNPDGSQSGEIINPPPELIQKAQFALIDYANEKAAESGAFEGERSSRHPVWRDPDEPEPKD